jgi:dephospho-CoA kinase
MLIAVCGLAGAGKTTTVDVLEHLGKGTRVYVGAFVTAEVESRSLPATPENERQVRDELRRAGGMDALAKRAWPTVEAILDAGRVALVDALYCVEEFEFYRARCANKLVRIAIETEKQERERRLAIRASRPLDADALTKRDAFELDGLGLARVMAEAEHSINNNGPLHALENALKALASSFHT